MRSARHLNKLEDARLTGKACLASEVTRLLCRCLFIQGLIQSAFLWGYTATQLLGGALADKYGGRAVIAAGGGRGAWNSHMHHTS